MDNKEVKKIKRKALNIGNNAFSNYIQTHNTAEGKLAISSYKLALQAMKLEKFEKGR